MIAENSNNIVLASRAAVLHDKGLCCQILLKLKIDVCRSKNVVIQPMQDVFLLLTTERDDMLLKKTTPHPPPPLLISDMMNMKCLSLNTLFKHNIKQILL